MPRLTVVLWLFYVSISLGMRIWIQVRTTGRTGFVLLRNRSSALQLIASAMFVSALLAGLMSPILALSFSDHPLWRPWAAPPLVSIAGAVIYAGGVTMAVVAQLTMGRSWRIGVDAGEETELITRGPFRIVRNPIFCALQLTAVGLALLCSTRLAWLACAVQAIALELQVRGVEEPYLARVHGEVYLDYTARVGRFLPGLGLRPRAAAGADPRA